MSVINDRVRRLALPDGSVVPDAYNLHQVDFVLWLPVMYVGYGFTSVSLAILLLFLLRGENESCKTDVAGWTYTVLTLISITAITSSMATILICMDSFQSDRVASFERFRVMMYRLPIVTRTTTKKSIFTLCIITDIITLLTALVGLPVLADKLVNCEFAYRFFMILLVIYQFIAVNKFFITVCHFMYG